MACGGVAGWDSSADRALGSRSVAMTMWKAMVSKPQAAEKVLRELLSMLVNQLLCKMSACTKDNLCILALAVSSWRRSCLPQGCTQLSCSSPWGGRAPAPLLCPPQALAFPWACRHNHGASPGALYPPPFLHPPASLGGLKT